MRMAVETAQRPCFPLPVTKDALLPMRRKLQGSSERQSAATDQIEKQTLVAGNAGVIYEL